VKDLNVELAQRKHQHLYRQRRISYGAQQVESLIDNKKVISFCSNDYLGLANHPKIKQAFIDGVKQYGVGSGAAHLVNGHSRAHHCLEEELAEFTGYPRALLFSTGYMANIGLAQSLVGRGDTILEDRLNHASLIDGALLSGARLKRYQHNNLDDLNDKLRNDKLRSDKLKTEQTSNKETLIMSDAVFSMDGDSANIATLANIAKKNDAWLLLDDAHGFGCLGADGKGSLQQQNISPKDVPIYMATLGKAVGTSGAFIAGSEALIETLIQKARSYIYTTATPPAIAEATRASLKIIQHEPQHREVLKKNISYFRSSCQQQNIKLENSETAIQPIIIGDDKKTLDASNQLLNKGLLVTAIRPPTVPVGTSRLRITLSAAHKRQHIDQLIDALTQI